MRPFTFLRESLGLPRSLRTAHRLNAFLKANEFTIFTAQDLTSEIYSLKTIKRLIKEFVEENLVKPKLLAYEITDSGREVYQSVRSHPEIQKFIRDKYREEEGLSRPHVTILENNS